MTTFLKEMEAIIKENDKLKDENDKLKEENDKLKKEFRKIEDYDDLLVENEELKEKEKHYETLIKENKALNEANIENRVQLNQTNNEIKEILLNITELKKDKISRGKKIEKLIKDLKNNKLEMQKIVKEKEKLHDSIKYQRDIYEKNWKYYQEQINKKEKDLNKYEKFINKEKQIKKWLSINANDITYRMGNELSEIINK
jgi:chromosome segregation ATPase